MAAQQESALKYDQWLNRKQNASDIEPDPKNTRVPEETTENEQQTDHKPEENRHHVRPDEATSDREEEKKTAEEFDVKRFMTDPDYRREMKEQRLSEQRERTETRERQQGQERATVTDRQR